MPVRHLQVSFALFFCAAMSVFLAGQTPAPASRRNVIIFVADGLRHGSINADDSPAFWSVRTQGVSFDNSHSLFPTFTTANASAIATGHMLGDTGDFSNTIWAGFPVFDTGNFGLTPGTPVPFIENNRILADLDAHFRGNFLSDDTLLAAAAASGYHTAAIGKVGPTAIQNAAAIAPDQSNFPQVLPTILIDDSTASATGWPLARALVPRMVKEGLPLEPPTRTNGFNVTSRYSNGFSGDRTKPGTLAANVIQQQWFADVTTRAILPLFSEDPSEPFAIVFWSRDPDGSQHNQGDSHLALAPGINGVTSKAGLRNADRNLQQILSWLDAHPAIKASTDVFVTSDHGFATISRREIEVTGRATSSEAARHDYVDNPAGTLPPGFLAIDLARSLGLNLFDPDQHPDGSRLYRQLHIEPDATTWEHPVNGNGLLGIDVTRPDGSDARVIVAANGGSDLIYVPDRDADRVRRIVATLLTYDYVGAVFVDEEYGKVPGALSQRLINLIGASAIPRPSIVVAFKVFYLDPDNLQTAIQISDTLLQEGQGMHGGFGRDSTFNNMAAIGPDFKRSYSDPAPVSNADIAQTLARLMRLSLPPGGPLRGRVLTEALEGQPAAAAVPVQSVRSSEANGRQTLLLFQDFAGIFYADAACLVSAKESGPGNCRR